MVNAFFCSKISFQGVDFFSWPLSWNSATDHLRKNVTVRRSSSCSHCVWKLWGNETTVKSEMQKNWRFWVDGTKRAISTSKSWRANLQIGSATSNKLLLSVPQCSTRPKVYFFPFRPSEFEASVMTGRLQYSWAYFRNLGSMPDLFLFTFPIYMARMVCNAYLFSLSSKAAHQKHNSKMAQKNQLQQGVCKKS